MIFFFLFLINANAAGFDCAKATLKIEKTICSNQRLSKLDDELSTKYNELMSKLNATGKQNLRKLQRKWLKLRNSEQYDMQIMFRYQYQIGNLNYFSKNIDTDKSISNSHIKSVFSLLIDNNLPSPWKLIKLNDHIYLLDVSNAPRMQQGLYGVNISNSVVDRIHGGLPELLHVPTDKQPVLIFKAIDLHRGILSTSIGFIYLSDSKLGVNLKRIFSISEDGESGGCGRGESIGLDTSEELLDYSFQKFIPNLILTFKIKETDCKNGVSDLRTEKYRFNGESYEVL